MLMRMIGVGVLAALIGYSNIEGQGKGLGKLIELKQEQEKSKVLKTQKIGDYVYSTTDEYNPNEANSIKFWREELNGTKTLIDEGTRIDLVVRGKDYYTYVIKSKEDGSRESYIKKYNVDKPLEGKKILEGQINFSTQGVSLGTNPKRPYLLAIVESESGRTFILDPDDKVLFDEKIKPDPEEEFTTDFVGWSEDNGYLWLIHRRTLFVNYYTCINRHTLEVQNIKMEEGYQSDYAINPSSGWIAYGDIPHFFDVDGQEEFDASKQETHLYLKNLRTKEVVELDKGITKAFKPKWISRFTVEYNDPEGDGRLTYTLPEAKDLECFQGITSNLLAATEFLVECVYEQERLGDERVVVVANEVIRLLDEALEQLNKHEFHSRDKLVTSYRDYLEKSLNLLKEQAILCKAGEAKIIVDVHIVEKEAEQRAKEVYNYLGEEWY